jgi:hypothetical protein
MGANCPSTVCCMNRQRIISTFIAAIAALCASAPAPAAETPPNLSVDRAKVLFSAGGGIAEEPVRPMQAEGGGGGTCWGQQLERSAGWYPYGRRLYLYTVWCGSGGRITYRSSSVWTSHDFMCWNTSGPHVAKTAGGAGWTYVQVQAWVAVACHSPWWFDWHDSLMMRVNYHPNGAYATVAWD